MKLTDQPLEHWIQRSIEICDSAHEGQTRNDGSPYKHHPYRVADAVEKRLKPIAFLHDVPEDTSVTIEDLIKEGFPLYIIKAVDVLTHKNKEPNLQYWARIKQNSDALTVKMADINDNLNDHPSEHSREKYAQALKFFAEP
jgi:(p)ppGpp synthase/HD superfamily hydrolase